MADESKRTWLGKLRERRQSRRARTIERQRQREEHQRDLAREGKASRPIDLGGGGPGG